jgi:hypothetical protein
MYNRDSFWSVVSVKDKKLNESIWEKWGGTQDHLGAIGTIITPYMGSIEKKGNEATCEWIWWGLINKRRFNSSLDTLRLRKALAYCIQEFDSDRDGIVSSQFSLSQNDVVYYEQKTSSLAEINLNHDEPFSHEIIPMDLLQPGCWWPSARVFSWNVFTHIALEVAGMRDP